MRRHKRNIVTAAVVLGLAAVGLIGSNPAQAGHHGCTDNDPAEEIGVEATPHGAPAYLAGVVWAGPTYYGGGACYALPAGVASGNAYSGSTTSQDATGDRTVSGTNRCDTDPGMVTLGCNVNHSADTTDDGNWGTLGKATDASVSGSAGGITLGTTGGYVGTPGLPLDLPGDGDTTTAAGADSGTGTCVWANGIPVHCPSTATIGDVTVNEADGIDPNTPGTGCWLGVGSTCAVQNTGVGVGQDGGDTVAGTVGGVTMPPANVPSECVQLGANC